MPECRECRPVRPVRSRTRPTLPGAASGRWMRALMAGVFLWLGLLAENAFAAWPVRFVDASGKEFVIEAKPRTVVSLSPAVTEILFRIGAGDALAGVTLHDRLPPGTGEKAVVGGFLNPSWPRVASLRPDLCFVSSIHREAAKDAGGPGCRMVDLESRTVEELYANIRLLGVIFGRDSDARALADEIRDDLALIARKVAKIPEKGRKKVVRVMGIGGGALMVPGDDSFQNELIRLAGGVSPRFGRNGAMISVTPEEWRRFDPDVVYACGEGGNGLRDLLSKPAWKDVSAVREGAILSFPCNLTCRMSAATGTFVSWLSASVYDREFAEEKNRVLPEGIVRTRPVDLPLPYVRSARVVDTTLFDFANKTLMIEFREPVRVVSTLEGERKGVTSAGNHYFPPPCWNIGHRCGLDRWKAHVFKALGKSEKNCSLLFTGADMGNLAVKTARFREMEVFALVTAGVESNAMRMSVDEGLFYEPGTINIVLLTNMRLTPRAMTRAILTATEAKTAAMQDLDVRSSVNPAGVQATGTGTDEVLVVEGRGRKIDGAGGHCKLGELIAKAVYDGVREAVLRQNAMGAPRSVFRRLEERRIPVMGVIRKRLCAGDASCASKNLARFEDLLLEPRLAGFLETALALSDARERTLVTDLGAYRDWCGSVADGIAGGKRGEWRDYVPEEAAPPVLRMALDALLNGLAARGAREAAGSETRAPTE